VTGYSIGISTDYATVGYSLAGVPLWTNRYNGPGDSADQPSALAVGSTGNVIVTGYSAGTTSYDYLTIAYSGAGVPLWTNRFGDGTNSDDYANGLDVDSNGNVFVTGYSRPRGLTADWITIAYSGAGVPLWTNRYGVPNSEDQAFALAVDSIGNVYITGFSQDLSGYSDIATIAYSGAGMLMWTNRYNGYYNQDDGATAVAVDSHGNVFVAGYSIDTKTFYDYATIGYSSTGVPLWTNRYNGPAGNLYDSAQAIVVDYQDNVIVTGSSDDGYGTRDFATIKYSGAGVPLWTNRYGAPNSNDLAYAMAVDSKGNIFVTGSSDGGPSSDDYATVAYSAAGVALWTNRYNGPQGNGHDYAQAVAVDSNGNVFVTGYSFGGIGTSDDFATIAYSSNGVSLWTNRYCGPSNFVDRAVAVEVGSNGNVFVTGSSSPQSGPSDYVTIAYSGAGTPLWTNRYTASNDSYDVASALAVDPSGNVFVTGSSDGDYATIAYSGAGVPLWTNLYSGPVHTGNIAKAIAVDPDGNVEVTGYSYSTNLTADYATVAYSMTGVPLWTNRYNGAANGDDQPLSRFSLAIAPDSAVYVAGKSDGNYVSNATTYDYAIVKYVCLPELGIQPFTGGLSIVNLTLTGCPGQFLGRSSVPRRSPVHGPI